MIFTKKEYRNEGIKKGFMDFKDDRIKTKLQRPLQETQRVEEYGQKIRQRVSGEGKNEEEGIQTRLGKSTETQEENKDLHIMKNM